MNCHEARERLDAYHESELDRDSTWGVSRHLESCDACRKLFEREWRVEREIRDRLQIPDGDERQVFARVLQRAMGSRAPRYTRWFAAALVLVAIGAWLFATRAASTPDLLRMAAADHLEYSAGTLRPDEPASGNAAIEYLQRELDAGALAIAQDAGYELEGARLCRFRGRLVGYLMLRRDSDPVSMFLLPPGKDFPAARRAADREEKFALEGDLRGLLTERGDWLVAVVGDLPDAELEALARAIH